MTDMKGREKDKRKSVDTKKVKGKPICVEGAAAGPEPWDTFCPLCLVGRKSRVCEAL